MTDNVTANQGAGGPVFKTDEVGGVHTPITKVAFGVDGTVTTVDASNPLPVSVASAVVSGEVALDAATLAALETVQIGNFPASQTVDGSVSVSNFPASQPVTGTFWQATQPISGTVTANTGLSQPVTDAQLRATPVPVSGTVSTGGLTDTQLRASAVPVSGAFYPATQPISATSMPLPSGAATSAKQDTIISALGSPMQAGGSIGNTQFGAMQSGAWTVAVNNFPATQPVSAVSMPLPTGAATDATAQAIQAMSDQIKVLNDTMLYYMSAVLEKMPRVTGNDQAAVVAEGGTISTVTTVTTCGTVNTISQIGTRAAMTAADAQIMQGTSHLYNNILVS